MRLSSKPLSFIVNFLLGSAWAFMLIGAITSFLSFYSDNLLLAISSAFVGSLPGMISILIIEHFITNQEQLEVLKKQTQLLENINNK